MARQPGNEAAVDTAFIASVTGGEDHDCTHSTKVVSNMGTTVNLSGGPKIAFEDWCSHRGVFILGSTRS